MEINETAEYRGYTIKLIEHAISKEPRYIVEKNGKFRGGHLSYDEAVRSIDWKFDEDWRQS